MLDRGLLQECGWRGVSELKAIQDMAVYDLIKQARNLRILEAGGRWVPAIDIYIEDTPSNAYQTRYDHYRDWFACYPWVTSTGARWPSPATWSAIPTVPCMPGGPSPD